MLEKSTFTLLSEIRNLVERSAENSTSQVPSYDETNLPYPPKLEQQRPASTDWIFYAVPGCGKTRSLEILLSRNWGFYFTAGSLPLNEGLGIRSLGSSSNIYDPRREGYPKDLGFLWTTVRTAFQIFAPNSFELLYFGRWMDWTTALAQARLLVLWEFLSIRPKAKPSDWLEFQRDFDPFSPLFWLLFLQQSVLCNDVDPHASISPELLRNCVNVGQTLRQMQIDVVYLVLDEAQHDLDARICPDEFTHNLKAHGVSTLAENTMNRLMGGEVKERTDVTVDNRMIQMFHHISLDISSILSTAPETKIQAENIYSGTSFRLTEMISYLRDKSYPRPFEVHSKYPLLRTERECRCLLNEQHIKC